ncbi:Uncharacterized protein YoxC, contains an MCP-like domain [Paenibacillus catalpae]|uniref:Uncharacterized protein YoxC, contains an MCP-like domain n=1 Tax=Paenibacillus catalpae TaxID=1045775 RepID=A0A1I2BJP0_9BACL|nr:DUF948 domain-containing protein [Paenibacillus catalpae]SFE56028.1 Uncharacterized protein YoxC, contains an MCP-like domain [Paenibacillus catalpae]
MDLFIQIIIAVITVAFVILMFFLIQTIKALTATLEEVRSTVGELRTDVSQISGDVKEMIHNTNEMTRDVRTKLRSLDVVFATVHDIGQTLHSFTGVMKETAVSLVTTMKSKQHREVYDNEATGHRSSKVTSAITDGILSSVRIWRKLKQQ